ncbi:DUF4286 family protein [Roseivirga sp. BDSF3-8]|uniref:DUF4286 family protein n=1 Tax=Roseivirga sp. BDSF3-8 TaxID=3241598 RepID=UPI0035320309
MQKSKELPSMVIYNVTVSVNHDIHDDWMSYMKDTHIPDVMNTGTFTGHRFLRLVKQEPDGSTYCIQYFTDSLSKLQQYMATHGPRLQKDVTDRYGEKAMAFRTILESVD